MPSTVIYTSSYTQRPTICEPLNDGTPRFRCVPEDSPLDAWVGLTIIIIIILCVGYLIGKPLFDDWRWKRSCKRRE